MKADQSCNYQLKNPDLFSFILLFLQTVVRLDFVKTLNYMPGIKTKEYNLDLSSAHHTHRHTYRHVHKHSFQGNLRYLCRGQEPIKRIFSHP